MLQLCAVDFTVANLLLPLIDECATEYDVDIACAPGSDSRRLEAMGYQFRYISFTRGMNPWAHMKAFVELLHLFQHVKYDVIHAHTPIASVLARAAARLRHVPVVINTVHGFYFHENMSPIQRRIAEWIERLAGRWTHFSFFQSHEDYEWALRLRICTPDTGIWIGNGVDHRRFDPDRPDINEAAARFRQERGISSTDVVIGIVARIVREKGIMELLQSYAAIAARYPTVRLLLVGDTLKSDRDGILRELEKAMKADDYGVRIHWVGYRNDVEVALRAMDLFVLPSYREGMPRSIIEAMSMGLPVIATNIRGCREEVVHQVTGLLVPPRDAARLAKALEELVRDPEQRHALGQAGLVRARHLYDERVVLSRQMHVLSQVVRGSAS